MADKVKCKKQEAIVLSLNQDYVRLMENLQ